MRAFLRPRFATATGLVESAAPTSTPRSSGAPRLPADRRGQRRRRPRTAVPPTPLGPIAPAAPDCGAVSCAGIRTPTR